MGLTRRGRAVLAVGVAGVVFAAAFGARALNAIVLPVGVALAAGYLQLRGREAVSIRRETPPEGFVGETATVELSVVAADGDPIDRPLPGALTDHVGDRLRIVAESPDAEATPDDAAGADASVAPDGSAATVPLAVGGTTASYDVTYERRGEARLGPTTVLVRDVLGLFERELAVPEESVVLVYPELYRVSSWGRQHLARLEDVGRSRQREEFERLREYAPGDSLRDIHWRTTAKRDELIVQEFAAEVDAESVTIAGGGHPSQSDEMATALASLSVALLEEGVPVSVTVPTGTVDAGPEQGNVVDLLRVLATVNGGRLRDPDADILVEAERDAPVRVTVGDATVAFDDLVGDGAPTVTSTDRVEVAQ
ncbi:MAG: DUF58 domain-containing protein [Halolamina sp.]